MKITKTVRVYIVVSTNETGTAIWEAFGNHSTARAYIRKIEDAQGGNFEIVTRVVEVAS